MKTRLTITTTITVLGLIVILMLCLPGIFAQSGRTIQPPPPPPPAAPPKQSDVGSRFVVDPSADTYRLIFPTTLNMSEQVPRLKSTKVKRWMFSDSISFIDQLNEAGAQGYKLVSALYQVGVMKLDETQYEYRWFETTSDLFFAKIGFEEKYAPLAEQGFRVVDHLLISGLCMMEEPISYGEYGSDTSAQYEVCKYYDMFLLEREKGVARPVRHALAISGPGWRAGMGKVLTGQVNEHLARGLYPTHAFSKFEVLLQEPAASDDIVIDVPEARVVTAPNLRRGGVQKKIKELTAQSYRLALVNHEVAVMYRDSAAAPVSYVWVNARRKDLKKRLAQLQSIGAAYRMTYPENGSEHQLIFEQRPVKEARREYKVLKFEFQAVEDAAARQVRIDLTPESKQAVKKMNKLAREGYIVRDLFNGEEISVLLERSR